MDIGWVSDGCQMDARWISDGYQTGIGWVSGGRQTGIGWVSDGLVAHGYHALADGKELPDTYGITYASYA